MTSDSESIHDGASSDIGKRECAPVLVGDGEIGRHSSFVFFIGPDGHERYLGNPTIALVSRSLIS